MGKIILLQEKRLKMLASPSIGEIRALEAADGFELSRHAKSRMQERDISQRQIMVVLRKGELIGEPEKDKHGSWRCKLKRKVSGRRIQIVIAIYNEKLIIVTVI